MICAPAAQIGSPGSVVESVLNHTSALHWGLFLEFFICHFLEHNWLPITKSLEPRPWIRGTTVSLLLSDGHKNSMYYEAWDELSKCSAHFCWVNANKNKLNKSSLIIVSLCLFWALQLIFIHRCEQCGIMGLVVKQWWDRCLLGELLPNRSGVVSQGTVSKCKSLLLFLLSTSRKFKWGVQLWVLWNTLPSSSARLWYIPMPLYFLHNHLIGRICLESPAQAFYREFSTCSSQDAGRSHELEAGGGH